MRVLIVEDDLQLGAALQRALRQSGFATVWVRRLTEARESLDDETVVLLDLGLPDGEGYSLLEYLRGCGADTPVLVITARDALDDRLRGFSLGADDYLVKPFPIAELVARLRAVLRRTRGTDGSILLVGQLRLDLTRHEAFVEDAPVELTRTEFRLLRELAARAGRVVARDTLIERVWGRDEGGSESALEFQVHRLRRKVGAARIRNVRGVGYVLEAL